MAYTAPTPTNVKARYPVFAAVLDATVQLWLNDAAVDCALWPEDIRARAEILYAAHRLAESGLGTGAIPAGVTSFKSGTFSATIGDSLASATGYGSTIYGREFLRLQRAYFAGPILAWQPPVADYA